MEETIYDWYGRPIAFKITESTQITIYDWQSRQPLAFYDFTTGMTHEWHSRQPVAQGNILESFIKR